MKHSRPEEFPSNEVERTLLEQALSGQISRRDVVKRAAMLGLTAPAVAGLLAACGDDDDDEDDAPPPPADEPDEDEDEPDDEPDEDEDEPVDEPDEEDDDDEPMGEMVTWNVAVDLATGGADPLSEYPTLSQYWLPMHVMEPLFTPALADDGQSWTLVPELASNWYFENDNTMVVELEQGVLFQNGEELTSEHVKRAFDAVVTADPPTRRTPVIRPLGECEIIDDYTVQFTMETTDLSVLGSVYQLLIPPLARYDMTAQEFEAAPIGTGPYRAVSWEVDGIVELEAWDEYRKGKVRPDRLVCRQIPDASTRVLELISGNVQIAMGLSYDAVAQVRDTPDVDVTALKGAAINAEVINMYKTDPPINDVRVRQAMNYAVDRDTIVATILENQAIPLPGPLSPGWLGYQAGHEPYPYDPDRARELLAEAGHESITVNWYLTPGPNKNAEVAQAVASQLEQVGINVDLRLVETAARLEARNQGEHDIVDLLFGTTWIPSVLLQFTLFTSLPDEPLIPVWGETPEPVVEARSLFREAGATTEISVMEERLAALHDLMHDEAFWLFVYSSDFLYGAQSDTGYRPFPTVYHRLYDEWGRRGMDAPTETDVPLLP